MALVAALLVLAGSTAAGAPADSDGVCVVLTPGVALGCDAGPPPTPTPAPGPTSSAHRDAAQAEPDEPAPFRRSSTTPVFDNERLMVTFKRGSTRQTVDAALANAHVTIERSIPPLRTYLVRVDTSQREDALASLRNSRAVEVAAREPLAETLDSSPNDSDWPQQVGLRVAGFPKAWDVTHGASKVVVAVVDTGVDPNQPDLRGALVSGYDFANSDADPRDDQGHGTAVAGIIAARADNHEGVAGICSRCSIMPVKVLDSSGVGDDTIIAAGIVWAADHGAQVINLSLGGPGTSPDLTAALAYAVRKGAVVVAAAGNSGTNVPFYPAADANALSVAATTAADRAYTWSNFGQWVNVAAPGCNIAPILGGGYGNFCGTSSATPLVAGLVALARSAEPTATVDAVKRAVERTASPLPNVVQYGRINAAEALAQLRATPAPSAASTATFSGMLDARRRTRVFTLPVGAGQLIATTRFTGGARLTVALRDARGGTLAKATGRSPLSLHAAVGAGPLTLVVRSATKRTRFVLTVSYVRPAAG